jgi:hypothetical protein
MWEVRKVDWHSSAEVVCVEIGSIVGFVKLSQWACKHPVRRWLFESVAIIVFRSFLKTILS